MRVERPEEFRMIIVRFILDRLNLLQGSEREPAMDPALLLGRQDDPPLVVQPDP